MEIPILFENNTFYEKEKYFSQFGSILNLVQFFFSETPKNDYDFSRFVAKEAVKTFKNREAAFYEKKDIRYNDQFYLNLGFYGANMSKDIEGEPIGSRINVNKFLGESYNLKLKELTHKPNSGLSYALLEPPYGLKYDEFIHQKAKELGRKKLKSWERIKPVKTKMFNHFLEIIELEINGENKLVIYEWDDNWSSYFDAGKEWWGTFYWTILNKEKGIITVIGASTTD